MAYKNNNLITHNLMEKIRENSESLEPKRGVYINADGLYAASKETVKEIFLRGLLELADDEEEDIVPARTYEELTIGKIFDD